MIFNTKAISNNTVPESENERCRIANRFATLLDPKLVISQASIFEYRFRDGPHPEMVVQFWIKSHPKMASGFESCRFPYVVGGNKPVNKQKASVAEESRRRIC